MRKTAAVAPRRLSEAERATSRATTAWADPNEDTPGSALSLKREPPRTSGRDHLCQAECPIPLKQRGVSLAFLRSFAEQKKIGARATTAEVCHGIIKPATQGYTCAYFDMLWRADEAQRDSTARWTGEAHFFLSHVSVCCAM